jgi:ATP-dependent exoDNAse (exonuclease V) beta subunit
MTLYDCCETLIREFSLYNESKEFVTSFLNKVSDYSTKNRQNLSEFLDYISENGEKLSLKVSSTQNAVNLMTIHKSKGLEFPIVICPIFSTSKESGDKIWVELQEKEYMMPIGWVSYKEEMTKTDFNEYYFVEKSKKQLDEINILYVAFTRPKEKLFVVTQSRKKRTTKTDSIQYYLEQFVGETDKYLFGDDTEKIKQSKEDSNTDKNSIYISSLLSEKSTISISPEKTSAIEEGILIHDIFSKIYDKNKCSYLGLPLLSSYEEAEKHILRDNTKAYLKGLKKLNNILKK